MPRVVPPRQGCQLLFNHGTDRGFRQLLTPIPTRFSQIPNPPPFYHGSGLAMEIRYEVQAAMLRPAFATMGMGRILSRRFFSQAAAASAGLLSPRPAGARLLNLHSQRNVSAATTAASHCFGFFPRIAIRSPCFVVGLGFWLPDPEEIEEHVEKYARPSEVDWVKAGVVSPVVLNQKDCGSCWAMALVASVEAVHCMKTSQPISLSVQELIDCNRTNRGCKGGSPLLALLYVWRNGLSREASYPYMAQRSISGCKRDKTVAARISGFQFVDKTEDALEKAVAKQPVVVCLQSTTNLQKYKGGVMEYEALPPAATDNGHAVLIVGYGTDPDGVKYWRFKNSWGQDWGEGGFGRIRRHVADKRGVLGIFDMVGIYPVLSI